MAKRGFTIVELLIVIVVIGILAAIAVASYTGITNNARVSQAKTNAEQAASKLEAWKIQNSDSYPVDEATAESITGIDLSRYIYNVNSATGIRNYCATYAVEGVSYSVSSKSITPVEGECVENLMLNPSFENNSNNWDVFGVSQGWTFNSIGLDSGGVFGDHYYRVVVGNPAINGFGPYNTNLADIPVTIGDRFSFSLYGRLSWGSVCTAIYTARDGSHSFLASSNIRSTYIQDGGAPGSWSRCSRKVEIISSGNAATYLRIEPRAVSYSSASTSDTFDIDAIMVVRGDTDYEYGDGNSSGWFWTGVENNSTSIGPAKALD